MAKKLRAETRRARSQWPENNQNHDHDHHDHDHDNYNDYDLTWVWVVSRVLIHLVVTEGVEQRFPSFYFKGWERWMCKLGVRESVINLPISCIIIVRVVAFCHFKPEHCYWSYRPIGCPIVLPPQDGEVNLFSQRAQHVNCLVMNGSYDCVDMKTMEKSTTTMLFKC